MGIKEDSPCNCKALDKEDKKPNTLFSPLKGKMKVLKKIKRRMGLGQWKSQLIQLRTYTILYRFSEAKL